MSEVVVACPRRSRFDGRRRLGGGDGPVRVGVRRAPG